MKIIAALDSYKGSLTSLEAGNAVKEGVLRIFPKAEVTVLPLADGGEGTVDALTYNGGERIRVTVSSPTGDEVTAEYGIKDSCAVIETAQAAGLPLVPNELRDPMHTTTYGVGQIILDAVNRGIRKFIIGLGGSGTNDCGTGMLTALGYRFICGDGSAIGNGAADLGRVTVISDEHVHPALRECDFTVISDVKNPLCGENGCSHVFAPQKGAKAEDVAVMDRDIRHFADICAELIPSDEDISLAEGSGAAGGMGFAFVKFLGGRICGNSRIMDEIGLKEALTGADLFITGEGRTDAQTAMGKAPYTAAMIAAEMDVPVIALSGSVDISADELTEHGPFFGIYPVTPRGMSLEEAMKKETAIRNIADTAERIMTVFESNRELFSMMSEVYDDGE